MVVAERLGLPRLRSGALESLLCLSNQHRMRQGDKGAIQDIKSTIKNIKKYKK